MRRLSMVAIAACGTLGACSPPATVTPNNASANDQAAPPTIDEHPASSAPGAAPDNSQVEPRHPEARNNAIKPDPGAPVNSSGG